MLILRAPCVSIDFGQVNVDRSHTSGLTLGDPVDLLTSQWRHADALIQLLDLFFNRKFQKIAKTSKNHRKSTIAPNAKIYIWKIIRKIQSIHLYWFHAYLSKLTWCLVHKKIKHLKGPFMSLKLESLIQNGSNPSGLSCISPTHPFCHVSCMHHIVAYCHALIMFRCVFCGRFCLQG